MKQLSVADLSQWLADTQRERPLLLDVREPWEFERCRIEGSELAPLGALERHLPAIDPERPVVCICHHGTRSFHAALALERRGWREVYNLVGGVDAWARQIDPSMATY
ncbi:MAG TPA: rhodanese-like domain-containing protein [Burkholderiaceae bacterium]|jgi:rhodanese-related sulfurtransferase|nr:rhodanese-like domain-containing protein [Burkholderiaceae bacterium]